MITIGLDIGTTKLCAIAVDCKTGAILETVDAANDTFIETKNAFDRSQDAHRIMQKVRDVVSKLLAKYKEVAAIGVTGQMHGIVYIDKDGQIVSPLYTWQDGRGALNHSEGFSYADFMSVRTGYKLATGYGSVTHFYNVKNNLVPANAVRLCTIHDYAAMSLANEKVPVTHPSDAASLGLYDTEHDCFDRKAIDYLGMDYSFYPEVATSNMKVGQTEQGIPVFCAIGDNQASFVGSVSDMENSVLVNVGTGSQISVFVSRENAKPTTGVEIRPCVNNKFLFAGCAICGGRAYNILKDFFNEIVVRATGKPCADLYEHMNKAAREAQNNADKIAFSTKFSGTRENPSERGNAENISSDNFTFGNFSLGVTQGIVDELYEMYCAIDSSVTKNIKYLVGSGNGIRKNKLLQELFSKKFNMPIQIPLYNEEAAYGAAIFAMAHSGVYSSLAEAQKLIKYE